MKDDLKKDLDDVKLAVSAIEKKFTMMEGTRTGQKQDGNMSNAINGEVDYEKDFENIAKKKMLVKKMME